jgi:threonine 3-dehydrogenase
MKALVKSRSEPGLWLEDIPEPAAGINDVLIRVLRTGICGTDLHIYEWDEWARSTIPVPMAIGHEFVGEVVASGSNVNDFHPGEIVSGEGHVVCGRCRNCLAGRRHLCAHTQGVGVNRPGAFAEFIALPMTNIWRHRPDVNLDVAAIFDPFGNAVHTALSFPVLGEDVLITGAGPIGIMAARCYYRCKSAPAGTRSKDRRDYCGGPYAHAGPRTAEATRHARRLRRGA